MTQPLSDGGPPVVLHVGTDVPRELLLAAGMRPVRLAADPDRATPLVSAMLPDSALPWPVASLLEAVLEAAQGAGTAPQALVIARDDAALPQLFAILREVERTTDLVLPPTTFIDVLHLQGPAHRTYVRRRVAQLQGWLAELVGRPIRPADLGVATAVLDRQRQLLGQLEERQRAGAIDARDVAAARRAAWLADPQQHVDELTAQLAADDRSPEEGPARLPVVLVGSSPPTHAVHDLLAAAGAHVAADLHPEADAWRLPTAADPTSVSGLADRLHAAGPPDPAGRVAQVGACLAVGAASAVVHLCIAGDDRAPWERDPLRRMLAGRGVPLLELDLPPRQAAAGDALEAVRAFLAAPTAARSHPAPKPADPVDRPRPSRAPRPTRSRKSLAAVADFGAHQRQWFAEVRERAAAGEPFAVVNADAPQEILRAMDIPYVVNQWWASIVGAKQQTGRYQRRLQAAGLPSRVEPYSAMGLAAALPDAPDAGTDLPDDPWGGLPTPTLLGATVSSDATPGLFGTWADLTGAVLLPIARTTDTRWDLPVRWWEDLPDRWDEVLEPARLDLLTAELRDQIEVLERATGRRFDPDRFEEVMHLVNEQEAAYRRTRDLIAATAPAPVGLADTMPATMVPQWHRGTTWGRDAAVALHAEVAERVAAGAAAHPGERLRLLWVGRGLWSDMAFYQRFEEQHGAVFVWSMYLGLAADGYLRWFDRGRDPLRALAARFATMGDELRMPTWAGAWHVEEARRHGAHGAVAIADADPFVLRALEAAGIPVLRLPIDNTDRRADGTEDLDAAVAAFLERLAGAR